MKCIKLSESYMWNDAEKTKFICNNLISLGLTTKQTRQFVF